MAGLMGRGREGPIPGTLADSLLQQDIINALGTTLRRQDDTNWRVTVQITEPPKVAPTTPEGRWAERWSFSSDAERIDLRIDFVPDGKGGTDFHIQSDPGDEIQVPDGGDGTGS
jgi:hypothetical protein